MTALPGRSWAQNGADAHVVGDLAVVERNVQVGPDEHRLPPHVGIAHTGPVESPARGDAGIGLLSHRRALVAQAPTAAAFGSSTFAASSTQRFE